MVAGRAPRGRSALARSDFFFIPLQSLRIWQKAIRSHCSPIGVGGAAFFGAAYLLHVAELRDVVLWFATLGSVGSVLMRRFL